MRHGLEKGLTFDDIPKIEIDYKDLPPGSSFMSHDREHPLYIKGTHGGAPLDFYFPFKEDQGIHSAYPRDEELVLAFNLRIEIGGNLPVEKSFSAFEPELGIDVNNDVHMFWSKSCYMTLRTDSVDRLFGLHYAQAVNHYTPLGMIRFCKV